MKFFLIRALISLYRMEVINLSGYTHEEKIAISKKYLIPKQLKENGITESNVEFSDDSISDVIKNFTMEAGLRNLERRIGALCRKVAMKIAKGEIKKTFITPTFVAVIITAFCFFIFKNFLTEDLFLKSNFFFSMVINFLYPFFFKILKIEEPSMPLWPATNILL